jgi:hypothetical protein
VAAVAIVIEKRRPARLAVVGILCGLAVFFSSTRGLVSLLGVTIFLVWEHRRKSQPPLALMKAVASLACTFLLTAIATNVYFVWNVGLGRFLDCTVIFPIRYYPADSAWNAWRAYLVHPPPLRPWYGLPFLAIYVFIHILVPLVYLLFLARYWRDSRIHPD